VGKGEEEEGRTGEEKDGEERDPKAYAEMTPPSPSGNMYSNYSSRVAGLTRVLRARPDERGGVSYPGLRDVWRPRRRSEI